MFCASMSERVVRTMTEWVVLKTTRLELNELNDNRMILIEQNDNRLEWNEQNEYRMEWNEHLIAFVFHS